MKNLAKIKVTKAEQKELLERLENIMNFNINDIQKELEHLVKFKFWRLFNHLSYPKEFYAKWGALDPYNLTVKFDLRDSFVICHSDLYVGLYEIRKLLSNSQEIYLNSETLDAFEFLKRLRVLNIEPDKSLIEI